jgi:hypothetical protein
VQVALEFMRPDELPDDTSDVATRLIYVNRLTPVACASAESTAYLSTWRMTDQYLSAGCSSLGSNIRYRWRPYAGASWTTWTVDTLYDFPGHSQTDDQTVDLQVKDLTTQQTADHTLTFTVAANQVVLSGPDYVTDKKVKTYAATADGSPHAGQWFERYEDGPTWYPATAYPQTSMTRIWPAGEYTVELRQHKFQGSLQRGRLHIEVCYQCGPLAPLVLTASGNASIGDWGLFGAGPWIGWGAGQVEGVVRLYDLWGDHDRPSAFSDIAWLDGRGGRFEDPITGWEMAWVPHDLGSEKVRAFDFSISGGPNRPYVFSFAVDPDLGRNAADDVASYDPERGLLVVADAGAAVGLLLRGGKDNALASVQEYGVGRFAPTTAEYAWAAQRRPGIHLVGTPRDVQLVLSTNEALAPSTWLFAVIRADSPASVRATADQVLRSLEGSGPAH